MLQIYTKYSMQQTPQGGSRMIIEMKVLRRLLVRTTKIGIHQVHKGFASKTMAQAGLTQQTIQSSLVYNEDENDNNLHVTADSSAVGEWLDDSVHRDSCTKLLTYI